MTISLNTNQQLYLQTWRKAISVGELHLTFSRASKARYAMDRLYLLRKMVHKHPELAPEIESRIDEFCLRQKGEKLSIYRKDLGESLRELREQIIGQPAEASAEKLASLIGRDDESEATHISGRINPYFRREEV